LLDYVSKELFMQDKHSKFCKYCQIK